MRVQLQKLSGQCHRVTVLRADGSTDSSILNSRSFLRHDFAHFAVESVLGLKEAYWGLVAGGMSLTGSTVGPELMLAERLSGPVQTLMRTAAGVDSYLALLKTLAPEQATPAVAQAICEAGRRLEGHWRATPFGESMNIVWPGAAMALKP